jgi:hypothetical protein
MAPDFTERGSVMRGSVLVSSLVVLAGVSPPPKTRVVVLGVSHSAQLVAESYQPAVLRAFIQRLRPAAIGFERSPEQYARNDHYEFTYEIQYLTLPYARELGIPVHPIDWYPPVDDQLLGFGVDLDLPPIVRPGSGFQAFLSFPDSAALHRSFFFADQESDRAEQRRWYQRVPEKASSDLPRRLFLYRTFMQAKRIAKAASGYPGKTMLVVIGSFHKDEIERILADDPGIEVVQPSTIGIPSRDSIAALVRREDRAAIGMFNLFGVQSAGRNVDWQWVGRVIGDRSTWASSGEAALVATRYLVLTGSMPPEAAAKAYGDIGRNTDADVRFVWTGVRDPRRIDSYFDPFGNLTVRQRANLELARELAKAHEAARADSIRSALWATLSPVGRAQLAGYWQPFVLEMR